MIQIDEQDQVAEEAVFSVQGILSAKNLPPITEKIKWVRYYLQEITNKTHKPEKNHKRATFDKASS